jgi:UDP-glucose 4-epimerase
MQIKNKNILITGGAGFIGSHLASRLADDNKLVIFDIYTTGRRKNIEHLFEHDNVKVLLIDIRDPDPLVKYTEDGFDYIFHLAAQSSVPMSIDDPVGTTENNIGGTQNILEAAKENGGIKVIFSSSAAVYGDDPKLPKLEEMKPQPKTPYAVSKIAGEQFCQVYYEIYDIPTVSLRYFNVFGPKQDPNSEYAAVVPKFIEHVINGKPPTIFGDGEQSRDFIYVDDVVDANIQAALSKKANGEVFNIAQGKGTTINELAETIAEIGESSMIPIYKPERPGDIKHSYANISWAKKLLSWKPKTKLKDGLMWTYDHFKTQMDKQKKKKRKR